MTRSWLDIAERGTVLGIRLLVFAATLFGRGAARFILKPVIFYYVLFHGTARRASQAYLRRVVGRASFGLTYRHFLNFAEVALDRLYFLRGDLRPFKVGSDGFDHLRRLREEKRGAILLGAHVGSFEAMRALAGNKNLQVNILTYRGNAKKLNSVLHSLNPSAAARFIEIAPGEVDSILRVKELVEAGEVVAILGDRADLDGKPAEVDFFGGKARFPTSPYALAAILKCPIFLTFNLYRSPDRYDCFTEPFVERLELPRGDRERALQAFAQRYASRVEHYCRLEPLNWFNFYGFWSADEGPQAGPGSAVDRGGPPALAGGGHDRAV